jgi:predicted Zn-dependent peptidase
VPPPPPRKFRQVRRPTIFFADKAATQAQVSATYPRPPLAASQRATARLYSEYIGGGMGALIFQELREARGLVYSARGAYSYGERPRDAAGLIAGLGTQADKTVVALSALTQLLGALEQPDPDRLATAKSSLLEEYRATRPLPRDLPALVMAWDDLGIASDPRPGYVKAIAAASAADLGAFAERAVDVAPVLAVTGDSRRIDLVALRKLGAVITVKPADLVSW